MYGYTIRKELLQVPWNIKANAFHLNRRSLTYVRRVSWLKSPSDSNTEWKSWMAVAIVLESLVFIPISHLVNNFKPWIYKHKQTPVAVNQTQDIFSPLTMTNQLICILEAPCNNQREPYHNPVTTVIVISRFIQHPKKQRFQVKNLNYTASPHCATSGQLFIWSTLHGLNECAVRDCLQPGCVVMLSFSKTIN